MQYYGLQRKEEKSAAPDSQTSDGIASDASEAVAAATSSGGASLPGTLQRKFEGSLGADLSSVRVHTGGASAKAAAAISARAYTTGRDIHFAAGQYAPSSSDGELLLAHEVAHTVQQKSRGSTTQHKLEVSGPDDHSELEADRAASAMVGGKQASVSPVMGAAGQRARDALLQRKFATTDDYNKKIPKNHIDYGRPEVDSGHPGQVFELLPPPRAKAASNSPPTVQTFYGDLSSPKDKITPGPVWVNISILRQGPLGSYVLVWRNGSGWVPVEQSFTPQDQQTITKGLGKNGPYTKDLPNKLGHDQVHGYKYQVHGHEHQVQGHEYQFKDYKAALPKQAGPDVKPDTSNHLEHYQRRNDGSYNIVLNLPQGAAAAVADDVARGISAQQRDRFLWFFKREVPTFQPGRRGAGGSPSSVWFVYGYVNGNPDRRGWTLWENIEPIPSPAKSGAQPAGSGPHGTQ